MRIRVRPCVGLDSSGVFQGFPYSHQPTGTVYHFFKFQLSFTHLFKQPLSFICPFVPLCPLLLSVILSRTAFLLFFKCLTHVGCNRAMRQMWFTCLVARGFPQRQGLMSIRLRRISGHFGGYPLSVQELALHSSYSSRYNAT
ncbi:hypothetical protein FA15DRAFT_521170 [Coprinopsis marcescibilis]|uniref:Uncharacterized protein n=1 Tax=Coprinopsis marcescibilis TaxID=230819 RepID=A0A5C3KPG8_COPMA|nr:hypothetical protein FA15DRAFT_521170 [Coprinopsis marcescibilis]